MTTQEKQINLDDPIEARAANTFNSILYCREDQYIRWKKNIAKNKGSSSIIFINGKRRKLVENENGELYIPATKQIVKNQNSL